MSNDAPASHEWSRRIRRTKCSICRYTLPHPTKVKDQPYLLMQPPAHLNHQAHQTTSPLGKDKNLSLIPVFHFVFMHVSYAIIENRVIVMRNINKSQNWVKRTHRTYQITTYQVCQKVLWLANYSTSQLLWCRNCHCTAVATSSNSTAAKRSRNCNH